MVLFVLELRNPLGPLLAGFGSAKAARLWRVGVSASVDPPLQRGIGMHMAAAGVHPLKVLVRGSGLTFVEAIRLQEPMSLIEKPARGFLVRGGCPDRISSGSGLQQADAKCRLLVGAATQSSRSRRDSRLEALRQEGQQPLLGPGGRSAEQKGRRMVGLRRRRRLIRSFRDPPQRWAGRDRSSDRT